MSAVNNVVICAAGVGSRLGIDKPKCLAVIEHRPLIHWQLDLLTEFETIVIVVGYQASEVMRTVLEKRSDAVFIVNHDYRTTNTLHSLKMGACALDEPFISLDGDLLPTPEAVRTIAHAPCPCIGIKKTYSEEPVCVELGQRRMVTGFTREFREYEWTGLAKLHSRDVAEAEGAEYVYQAVERILPVSSVEVDCVEIDTIRDLQEAEKWMKEQLSSGSFGRIAAGA
jgi:choline kinase